MCVERNQHGVAWDWGLASRGGRAIQDDGRGRHGSRTVSWRGIGADRLAWGQVQVVFGSTSLTIEQVKADKLNKEVM